jgi:GTP-sensing pleiotropic transcriptional regulator CodY
MLAEAKGANCDGVLSVQLIPSTPADRVGIAQFTLLDVKQLVSAAAIDSAALGAGSSEGTMPKGSAPKL